MKKAFGTGAPVLITIRPRSTNVRSGGGIFVCLACGPPRHVRSWKRGSVSDRAIEVDRVKRHCR